MATLFQREHVIFILILLSKINFSTFDLHSNYQGHLHCGAKLSGKTSSSTGFQHYYSFILTQETLKWNISSCGSHIYTFLTIYDSQGTVQGGTNGNGCEASSAMITYGYIIQPANYYIEIKDDYQVGDVYVLSFQCSPHNKPPDFYYNSTLIPNNDTNIISCDDILSVDIALSTLHFYQFYVSSTVDVLFDSITFNTNINNECWTYFTYYLDTDNQWIQKTNTDAFQKGIYKLVTQQICSLNASETVTINMKCSFEQSNDQITYYNQSPWIKLMDDISCGLTVKGHAMNGKVYSYQFVTRSTLSFISLSTCKEKDAKSNGLSLYKYETLKYDPYVLDKFGYWTSVTYSRIDSEQDTGCNRLNWSHLANNTHYLVTIAIPYWLSADYTIYMQCSDNSAVERAISYDEYIRFASPSKASPYIAPSKNNVLLCDETKTGYLSSFFNDNNVFYAFKVTYYQYYIEFDSCSFPSFSTFDIVLSLYHFITDKEWINVKETHSYCNKLIYFGVEPGYYYILLHGVSSFDYGNFSVSMKCLENDAIVYPDYNENWVPDNIFIGLAIGVPVSCVLCLICAVIMCKYQSKYNRDNNHVNNDVELEMHQQRQMGRDDHDDMDFTPQKPHKSSIKHVETRIKSSMNIESVKNNDGRDDNDGMMKNNDNGDDEDGIIKSQPTLSYSAMNCVICLDILLDHESCKLGCGHKFHTHCIEEYNETNKECPLCRKAIVFQ